MRFFVDPKQQNIKILKILKRLDHQDQEKCLNMLQGEQIIIDDKRTVHHIVHVRRKKLGDELLCCFWSQGHHAAQMNYIVKIVFIDHQIIKAIIIGAETLLTEPKVKITVAQAWLKNDKWEWLLQKGTEIGAFAFISFPAERSLPLPKGILKRQQRWQDIIHDAAVQAKRGMVPQALVMPNITAFFTNEDDIHNRTSKKITKWDQILIAHPLDIQDVNINRLQTNYIKETKDILLFIGPPGGFTAEEIAFLQAQGGKIVTLGPRVLRAETSSLAFLVLLIYSTFHGR